jgi:hypothetical protein
VDSESITIVSGLPRSGTSMMMRMLEAGGLQVLVDNLRTADADNPKGYYEFEKVKEIQHDSAWLEDAKGKVIKMITALLQHLPEEYDYRVVFMRRDIEEVLASQRQMLIHRGEPTDAASDERMRELFRKHLERIESLIEARPNIECCYVDYSMTLKQPLEEAERVNHFLGVGLDVKAMTAVVDPELYRQRRD